MARKRSLHNLVVVVADLRPSGPLIESGVPSDGLDSILSEGVEFTP